jgi:DnaJ-domain-containing protein 1
VRAYALLGVRPGASRAELENAYRAALERYNPNKVIDLGTEFASLAVQKLAQATAAFEFALAAAEREVA